MIMVNGLCQKLTPSYQVVNKENPILELKLNSKEVLEFRKYIVTLEYEKLFREQNLKEIKILSAKNTLLQNQNNNKDIQLSLFRELSNKQLSLSIEREKEFKKQLRQEKRTTVVVAGVIGLIIGLIIK